MARTPTPVWMCAAALCVIAAAGPALRGHPAVRPLAALTLGALLASLAISRWAERVVVPTGADLRVLVEAEILDTPARAGTELRFDAAVRILSGAVPRDGFVRR